MSYDRNLSISENAILNREPKQWRPKKSQLVPCRTEGCKKKANMYTASGLCFYCIHYCRKCGRTVGGDRSTARVCEGCQ